MGRASGGLSEEATNPRRSRGNKSRSEWNTPGWGHTGTQPQCWLGEGTIETLSDSHYCLAPLLKYFWSHFVICASLHFSVLGFRHAAGASKTLRKAVRLCCTLKSP